MEVIPATELKIVGAKSRIGVHGLSIHDEAREKLIPLSPTYSGKLAKRS